MRGYFGHMMGKYGSVLPLVLLAGWLLGGLAACDTRPVEYEFIPLHHGLGVLQLRAYPFFDTLTQWTHTLDCDCCHLRKVRLSSKDFPPAMEDGWKYPQPDSLLQLTVIQPEKAGCDTAFTVGVKELQIQLRYLNELFGYQNPLWIYRKLETIDGYPFIVLGCEIERYRRYNDQNFQQLLAITSIDGERVTLDFSCRAQDCGNFLKRAYWLLQRMEIHRKGVVR